MKTIAVIAITAAALTLGTGVAHADAQSDYFNDLKSHGLTPAAANMSESAWETMSLKAARDICTQAGEGSSHGLLKAKYEANNPGKTGVADTLVDAAIMFYCPQYW
jgi:hypothetical protein